MTKVETPVYVELFAALGVTYVTKTLVGTVFKATEALEEGSADAVAFLCGIVAMLGYIALRNRAYRKAQGE